MKSGTVHDQDGAGLANGLPARSVMVDAKLTAKTPGSAKEVGSPITIEAVVPSGLSVAVLATAVPPIVNPIAPEPTDDDAIASEKVTVMGARSTTLVAPVVGIVETTLGAVRSTFTVTGADAIGGEPDVLLATRVWGPSATLVVSQVYV